MKKTLALLLALLLLLPAAAGAEKIVTSFYPVWILALNLAEGIDGLDVVNLTDPATGCLHNYSLLPSDWDALSSADALLVNGAGMESSFLPKITEAYPQLPVIEAAEGLPALNESGMVEIGEHEEGEEINAHLWLDPQRAAGMAENLANGIIRILPAYEQQVTDNLKGLRLRLLGLDETLREQLQDTGRRVIIFHEAFPYFAEACGLSVAAVVNKEPEDALPTAQLARVVELIGKEVPAPVIIKSAEADPSVDTLVNETGIAVCELDPLTTGPKDPPLDYYEAVMVKNMNKLLEMLR